MLKSVHRHRMKIETENTQLCIHYNMSDHENGIQNEIIDNTKESMVKHKSISRDFFLVQENIKEKKKMKFLLEQ